MASYFFSQQAQGWQQMFRRSQSGGFFSRLLAWLVLGVALTIGLVVVMSVILLSWLLIPVLLFKKRRAAKARSFQHDGAYGRHAPRGEVIRGEIIEGVVTEVKE